MSDEEEQLRTRFAKLRDDDARRAPSFERMWSAPPRRQRSPWVFVAPAASLAAAAAVLVIWCGTGTLSSPTGSAADPPAAAASPAAARIDTRLDPGPLDFLLETPGGDLLASSPEFDSDDVVKR